MVSNQSFYSEVGAAIVEPLPNILNIRIARSLESPCELASSCGVGLSMGIVRLRTRSSSLRPLIRYSRVSAERPYHLQSRLRSRHHRHSQLEEAPGQGYAVQSVSASLAVESM